MQAALWSKSSLLLRRGSKSWITTTTKHHQQQPYRRRSLVSSLQLLLQKPTIYPHNNNKESWLQKDLDHAVDMVKSHDPAGFLPGRLLPTSEMQVTYYAVRSFWVETGLRFGTTAHVPPNSSPAVHLEWWKQGIDTIYDNHELSQQHHQQPPDHPTLRLLSNLLSSSKEQHDLLFTKCHFEDILKGRFRDLDLKQYPDMASLEEHSVWSCGSLAQLVLESDGIFQQDHPVAHRAAKLVGACHGLTNALRTSIPVISTTGKLVVPQDLCQKYNVKSPRYLLSALGQGDEEGIQSLRMAVQEIANLARDRLKEARSLREEVLATSSPHALAVLLPGLASEAFLNRLEQYNFDLTNQDLRRVSWLEHAKCATRMMQASYQQTY